MLDEIINSIGYDNIMNYLENDISFGDAILIQVDIQDKKIINFMNIDKKNKDADEVDKEQLSWFKKRVFYCDYLSSNKALVVTGATSKLLTSCIKESISFNFDTFIKKLVKLYGSVTSNNMTKYFITCINDYYEVLQCKYYAEGVDIKYLRNILIELSEDIINLIKDNGKGKKIRIFFNAAIEDYINSNLLYMKDKIFDNGTESIVDGSKYGRYSGFITLNPKKPLLKLHGSDEINIISEFDAIRQRNLLMYLTKNGNQNIQLKYGAIKLLFNPKDMVIEDYDYIPFISNEYIQEIPYSNILQLSYLDREEDSIKLNNIINYLLDGNLYKTSTNKYAPFQYMYKDIINEFMVGNTNNLFYCYKKMIDIIININKLDYVKTAIAINLRLILDCYFNSNTKGEIFNMHDKMLEKLKDFKNLNIENDDEFFYMCGQLAYYLASKSKSVMISNKLIVKYMELNTIKKLKTFLAQDMKHYAYDERIGSRINLIFSKLLEYDPVTSKINIDYLLIGLYGDNIFYQKVK